MRYLLAQASAHRIPLRDESVQCVVTSPPYWGLRAYAGEQCVPEWGSALGLEPTPGLYVEHMVEVFREVRRVLRKDGTLWLNLGDSYTTGTSTPSTPSEGVDVGYWQNADKLGRNRIDGRAFGLPAKNLVGIPWRVAFALQADGWYLRSDIIWSKPNPMPESVTDRPTKSHEYLFLLSKSERYFYDADGIREDAIHDGRVVKASGGDAKNAQKGVYGTTAAGFTQHDTLVSGRNARTVWTIATQPYPGAHFATFPEELPERCIKAGSAAQACGVCGAPWERVTERGELVNPRSSGPNKRVRGDAWRDPSTRTDDDTIAGAYYQRIDLGFRPTCAHEDGSASSVIFDPFNGSGTTGRVALRLGRRYVGLDLSREYLAEQAIGRIDPLAAAARGARNGDLEQMVLPL